MAKKKPIREYIRVRIGKPAFIKKAGFHFYLLCAGIGCGDLLWEILRCSAPQNDIHVAWGLLSSRTNVRDLLQNRLGGVASLLISMTSYCHSERMREIS